MKKRKVLVWLFSVALSTGAMAQGGFRHPGLLHSEADFQSIRDRVAAGDADMVAALDGLRNSRGIVNPGNMGVTETIVRGISGQNYMNAYRGAAYAYQCALMWKITGETSYADRAVETLNAWRTWNKYLGGNTNVSLIPGFTGYQFANAAELMRDYRSDAWGEEEFNLFKQYLIDVWFTTAQDFLERRHDTVTREGNWYHYHSNWGLGNAMFCVAMGILCDSPDIYNYGMWWIKEGPGNESLCVTGEHPDQYASGMCGYGWGLIPWFHKDSRGPLGYLNQMQESGRDQGHSMAALGLLSYAFQYAYNQGDNAFCNLNNGLIPGEAGSAMVAGAAEYVAAYNAGHDDLPYRQNWWMGGLNGTGRGQFRPIWQLFINHYENRMGIPMKYCHEMEDAIGMELGGGSYGGNSGGYDHTGFGTLMHNDGRKVTADEVPTILFPQIASTTETRNYAEISQVEPGSVLTLAVKLPDGETDTGKWQWEDGATGSQRQVTADHSGIYRVTYTNAKGVESTQMFSVAVRGEGMHGTLSATATYNSESFACGDTTEIKMAVGRTLSITTAFANWNYIESEKWYLDGEEVATGGTYNYRLGDQQSHELVFRLTNQSGVVVEKVFNISFNENELTSTLPDPECADVTKWNTDAEGFQNQNTGVTGLTGTYIGYQREASENGMDCWGLARFDISQTLSGLKPGKYRMKASVLAAQQSLAGTAGKNFVKDLYLYAGGTNVAVATQDGTSERYTLDFYVGEDGTVTFGARNMVDQNRGYSAGGANWFAMDNFTLEYLGTEDLAEDLEDLRRQAADVAEGTVTDAIYQTLAGLKDGTDNDADAAVALQQALGEARLAQAHYAEYHAAYTGYKNFVETNHVDHAALTAALDAFGQAETAEELYAAFAALQDAWMAYLPDTEMQMDVTTLLHNAGLEASDSGVMYDESCYWRTDATGGNFRIFAIDGSDTQRGDAQGANMIERWCEGNFAAGVRLVWQATSGVPLGRYVFRAAAQKDNESGVINLFANDDTAPVGGVHVLAMTEVATEVSDGVLRVGLQAGEGNGCRWTSMADVSLAYYSPIMLLEETLEEAEGLTYGTDEGGALQAAMTEARNAEASGTAEERMAAFHALEDAIGQYKLDNASAEHPVDMTGYIRNADFNGNNAYGWSLVRTDQNYPKFNQGVMELWHTTFDLSQTVTGLPAGNYRLYMQARSDAGARNGGFYLYAQTTGGNPMSVYPASATRADGSDATLHLGQNAEDLNADATIDRVGVSVFVGDGRLKVGASCNRADMWCVINGFTLEYQGMDDSNLLAYWNSQVAVARALDRDSLPQTVGAALDEAVDVDAESMGTEALTAALETLMATIEDAQGVMPPYKDYLRLADAAEEIAANSEPSMSALLTIFNNSINGVREKAKTVRTVAEVQALYDGLEAARQTYVVDAEPLNGIGFDLTFKVANPECTADGSWLNDGTVNFRTLENAEQNGGYAGRFYENWTDPGKEWTEGQRPIYQEITSLPNGSYELTAAAFRKVQLSDADASATDISLYLNGQQAQVETTVLDYVTVRGAVTARTAEIGLVAGEGNTANWVGLADVKLMYYGSTEMEMAETDREFTVENGSYGTVSMEQELQQGWWNVVCLPFDLSSSQVRKVFDDVKELSSVDLDENGCNLRFEDVREMKAGVPYLVQVEQGGSLWSYANVAVDAQAISDGVVEIESGSATVRWIGTSQVTALEGDNLYTYNMNTFTPAESGTEVNGFRAYLQLDGAAPAQVNLYVDGDLTAIGKVTVDGEASVVDVYTMDGRLMRKAVGRNRALQGLPSGVYVVGGQKVVK